MSLILFGLGMLAGIATLAIEYARGAEARDLVVTGVFTLYCTVFAVEESIKTELRLIEVRRRLENMARMMDGEDE